MKTNFFFWYSVELLELVLSLSALLMMGCKLFYLAIGLLSQVMPRSIGIMHSPSKHKDVIQRVLEAKFHVLSPYAYGTD